MSIQYIFAHRVHPTTHKGYLVVAHCAFSAGATGRGDISPIQLRGQKASFVYGVKVEVTSHKDISDAKTLRGLPVNVIDLPAIQVEDKSDGEGTFCEINIPGDFPPGSVAIFATSTTSLTATLDAFCVADATAAFAGLDLVDLNVVMYRADGEERDFTDGQDGIYKVPGMGEIVYCGLEGWMYHLRHVMRYNDLGHPLCAHLRDGPWPMDYVQGRLLKYVVVVRTRSELMSYRQSKDLPRLAKPAQWLKERFDAIKAQAPSFMRPKYFALVINSAYKAARDQALSQMSPFITQSHTFTHKLALTAVQMLGIVHSASLDPFETKACLAAGLPHFTAGWARTWGRDVCISLRVSSLCQVDLFLTKLLGIAARDRPIPIRS
jgi:glycogen debranching enzyme